VSENEEEGLVVEKDEQQSIAKLMNRIEQVEANNRNLENALKGVAQTKVLADIIHNGFEDVIAELRPLRELTPQRASDPQATADAVTGLLAAMRGVDSALRKSSAALNNL